MASCFFFKDFKILLEIRMDQVIIGKVDRNSVIISLKDHGKRNFPFFNGCGGLIRMVKSAHVQVLQHVP